MEANSGLIQLRHNPAVQAKLVFLPTRQPGRGSLDNLSKHIQSSRPATTSDRPPEHITIALP